jgi:hypothetical protein
LTITPDACSNFSENAILKMFRLSTANVSSSRAWVARSWTGSTERPDNQPLLWERRRYVNPRIHAIGSEVLSLLGFLRGGTGRDAGTSELAVALADAIEKRMGKRPYLVISKVHRKYLDPNRPSGIAYEDSDAAPVYQRYHGMLQRYCKEILEEHHTGLLLDIHGQGSSSKTLYRGTANGKTVARLKERFGESAHTGEKSLFGTLGRLGWTVFPPPGNGKEQSGFTGGYIVQTHGSHQPNGLDAMQLEFGADYRNKTQREKTAEVLSQAVQEYLEEYVEPISKAAAAKR